MNHCCADVAAVALEQRRTLQIVLGINAIMFLVECGVGLLAGSTALLADSVDMLGDAIVYGFGLYVVGRGPRWQARGALLKGLVMGAFGIGIFVEAAVKIATGGVPIAGAMAGVGLLALGANVGCLLLLRRRRADDVNMRSAWICSRNDVAANAGVLVGAGGVFLTGSAWPDIVVGLVIATMFAKAALGVIGDARRARLSFGGG
jgi:cation diffusion facilitator family transporter